MEIKVANSQAEIIALILLRRDVFIFEQKVPLIEEFDEIDKTAIQLVVIDNQEVIATCRVIPTNNKYKIGRFAVKKAYRKQKIGSKLLEFIEKMAKTNNIDRLTLAAQITAIDFYQANGYKVYSDIFLDAGIEHLKMEKTI
ncbi:MAG: GNAT family N-acetyltransferase [Erysipelotrichaceae bacterium]